MKYFLPCENCTHQNEVTSEYVTFCGSCGKKIKLNYGDWHKKHRDSSLEDYLKIVCISEEIIEKQAQETLASKKDSWSHWIGISMTLAVIIGISFFLLPIYFSIDGMRLDLEASTYANHSYEFKWEERTFGSLGMQINSPLPLKESSLPLTDDVSSTLEVIETFVGGSEKEHLMIMLNNMRYAEGIPLSLQGAADGSINSMRNTPNVINLDYSQTEYSINDKNGFRQDGSYEQAGLKMNFINVGVVQDRILWQVLIIYRTDIEGIDDVVQKAVNSVEINYNSTI